MAVRQYIGARYVTKIYENSLDPSSAEWEADVTYEPLTMVTYNNSSYLSKKDVPGSVGNPAANPSYWVVTGAYNGQIAALQQDISDINAALTPLTNKKLGIVTDSYGTVSDTWANNLAAALNLTLDLQAVGGMGYVHQPSGLNKTFIDLLDDFDPDDNYDTILVYGGQNDIGEASADITSAVSAFITKAKTLFPHAKLYICGPQSSVATLTGTSSASLAACEEAIQRGCNAIGGVAYCNPANWLSNAPDGFGWYYASDNTHPNADGYKVIEINMLNLLTGNLMSECNKQFTFTATNYVATDLNVYAAVDHNKIHFDGTAKAAAELTAGSDYIFMNISNNLYAFIALGNERAILRVYKVVGGRYTFVGCMRPGGTSGNRNYRFTPDVTINANEDLFIEGDIYMNSRHQ